jgi:hypothetical protein
MDEYIYSWSDVLVAGFRRHYGPMSDAFVKLLDGQLADDFKNKTGIDVSSASRRLCLSPILMHYEQVEDLGILRASVNVLNEGVHLVIKWKYRNTKRPLLPSDEEINFSDAVMWLEDFDARKAVRLFFKKPILGFKLSRCGAALEVDFFYPEHIYLCLWHTEQVDADTIKQAMEDFASLWNEGCESGDTDKGVIHTGREIKRRSGYMVYYFDLGSAGRNALRGLLGQLCKLGGIDKIRLTSFLSD